MNVPSGKSNSSTVAELDVGASGSEFKPSVSSSDELRILAISVTVSSNVRGKGDAARRSISKFYGPKSEKYEDS